MDVAERRRRLYYQSDWPEWFCTLLEQLDGTSRSRFLHSLHPDMDITKGKRAKIRSAVTETYNAHDTKDVALESKLMDELKHFISKGYRW